MSTSSSCFENTILATIRNSNTILIVEEPIKEHPSVDFPVNDRMLIGAQEHDSGEYRKSDAISIVRVKATSNYRYSVRKKSGGKTEGCH